MCNVIQWDSTVAYPQLTKILVKILLVVAFSDWFFTCIIPFTLLHILILSLHF